MTPLDSKPVRALLAVVLGMLAALPAQASEQLVLLPDPNVLLVLLVAFVAIIFPLNRLIFQPLSDHLDVRSYFAVITLHSPPLARTAAIARWAQ